MKYGIGPLILAYVAFIALGMPDGLLGVAWPTMRHSFDVPLDALGILLAALMAGYMTASFFSGPVVARMGIGPLLALSCALTGLALVGYTLVPRWWMAVVLGLFGGLGAGAIDAGLNAHIAAHYHAGLMQWLHAFWGVGVTTGPVIMTLSLATEHSWRGGYLIVGVFQILLAVCFAMLPGIWEGPGIRQNGQADELTDHPANPTIGETLRQPMVWIGLSMFFLYAGAESSLGIWVYTLLTESRSMDTSKAGLWTGGYWALFTVGRMTAGFLAKRVGINVLVTGGLIGASMGVALLAWNPFELANPLAVGIVGLGIAPIFPALTSATAHRVGRRFMSNAIGMQMMAAGLGMALIPGLIGIIADTTSLEVIPVLLLAVYGGILALHGAATRLSKRIS